MYPVRLITGTGIIGKITGRLGVAVPGSYYLRHSNNTLLAGDYSNVPRVLQYVSVPGYRTRVRLPTGRISYSTDVYTRVPGMYVHSKYVCLKGKLTDVPYPCAAEDPTLIGTISILI